MSQCPKCLYVRTKADSHAVDGVCPACGIVYKKWQAANSPPDDSDSVDEEDLHYDLEESEDLSLFQRIKGRVLEVPDSIDPVVFWGRVILFGIFFIWGWWFILTGGDWTKIGSSFLHSINLAFHEFGHVLFRPFGRFMTILGGSLFQIMMPLIVMIAFIRQYDNFEASIMLWWTGQNFIDLSPYISDGEYRGLPLISGMGEESHDWGNLLTMMNSVDKAYIYGKLSFNIGVGIILLSFIWSGYILYQQKKNATPF